MCILYLSLLNRKEKKNQLRRICYVTLGLILIENIHGDTLDRLTSGHAAIGCISQSMNVETMLSRVQARDFPLHSSRACQKNPN